MMLDGLPKHSDLDPMRTTIAIDDDVLAAARHLAERDRRTLGEVLTALARQGLDRAARAPQASRNGVLLLPITQPGAVVTLDLVNELRDEAP